MKNKTFLSELRYWSKQSIWLIIIIIIVGLTNLFSYDKKEQKAILEAQKKSEYNQKMMKDSQQWKEDYIDGFVWNNMDQVNKQIAINTLVNVGRLLPVKGGGYVTFTDAQIEKFINYLDDYYSKSKNCGETISGMLITYRANGMLWNIIS